MKRVLLLITVSLLSTALYSQYRIPASVFGSGGSTVSNSNFRTLATAGQTVAGFTQGGNSRMSTGWSPPAQLLTPLEEITRAIPFEYRLDQNYPNPFNPTTMIRFAVKERSHITLVVFNVLGQAVSTLVNEELSAGEYETRFSPSGLASGLYFYRITANGFVQSRRMLLIK